MIDAPPNPPNHAIGTALYMVLERGGHATTPRALRAVNVTTQARDVVSVQTGYALSVPKKPAGCTSSKFHLSAYSKRHGIKASQFVTYWCSK